MRESEREREKTLSLDFIVDKVVITRRAQTYFFFLTPSITISRHVVGEKLFSLSLSLRGIFLTGPKRTFGFYHKVFLKRNKGNVQYYFVGYIFIQKK